MISALFFFILSKLTFQSDQYHIDAPTSMLIDESSEDFWTRYKIDRSHWTAKTNSEQTTNAGNEGPISNILDGQSSTIWHSQYNNNGNGGHNDRTGKNDPFIFTVDLGRDISFRAFSYMPRQSGDPNGRFRLYEFYVGHTEEELNEKILNSNYVSKGFIDHTSPLSTLVILTTSENGRFVALRSLDHDTFGTCAEFNLYRDPYQPTPTPIAFYIDESRDKFWSGYKISRSGWTATANSEQTTTSKNEGPISNILDGNVNTIWHSRYNNNEAGGHDDRESSNDPFHFVVDLGRITAFRAFSYMPRNNGPNGRFPHFDFFIANTRDELNTKMQSNNYSATGDIDTSVASSTMAVFNYVETGRFVALRSSRNQRYGTCAEFNLYSDPPSLPSFSELKYIDEANEPTWSQYKISRNGWNATANSEHTTNSGNEGPIRNILDGNKATLWHTKYGSGGTGGHDERPSSNDPFQFTIDLGKNTTFRAFAYMPRGSNSENGRFRHYEFYAASTEEELTTLISNAHYLSKGLIDKSTDKSSLVILDRVVTARYVALLSLNHDSYATCSEFNLYSDPPVSSSTPTPTPLPTPESTLELIDLPNNEYWLTFRIDRSEWRISANSEQAKTGNGEGPITHILDGNTATIWHSRHNQNDAKGHDDRPRTSDPYQFAIDMKQQETIIGFTYQKRQTGTNGEIEKYEFYAGETSEELFIKIRNKFYLSKGNFDKTKSQSYFVRFNQPISCRYVALLSLENNYATCAEFNVFRYPPATPTASPSQSMTPTAAPPGAPPDIVVYDPKDNSDGRVEVKQEFHQYIYVKVDASSFTNVSNPEDGGAIHIDNAGIQLDKTTFSDCKSEGAGGAIYISNTYSMENNITFENLEFRDNEAQYGGAIYVYSSSVNNLVMIKHCNFINNKATQPIAPKTKSGGSAIFLTARRGDVGFNTFVSHDDAETVFRIYNKFDKETQAMNLDSSHKDGFVVSDCIFEKNKCLKASLFYTTDSNGSPFELINCKFLDNLQQGAHYIDGLSLSRNSPKLSVKRCKFSSNLKNSFNENNNFMSVDLNDQVFSSYSDDVKKESLTSLTIATGVVVSVAVIAIVSAVVIFIVVKRKKNNDNANDGHEMNTMTQDLLNENL